MSNQLTVVLQHHAGVEVLAKLYKGTAMAVTYANRTQAERKAAELGAGWAVYHWGRPFLVGRLRGHCRICSEWLPHGEVICGHHEAAPLDERWNDCKGNAS